VRAEREVRNLDPGGGPGRVQAAPAGPDEVVGTQAAGGGENVLAVDPDLDVVGLGDDEDTGEDTDERNLQGLGLTRGDGQRKGLGSEALLGDLHRVLPGQDIEGKEVGEAQVQPLSGGADESDAGSRRLGADRQVPHEGLLHGVEEVDDLGRHALLREGVVRLDEHDEPEVLRGLLLQADAVVRAAPILVGFDQDVPGSTGQVVAGPDRLEAGDDVVEANDRTTLLGALEVGDGSRERLLCCLDLQLNELGHLRSSRGLLGSGQGRRQEHDEGSSQHGSEPAHDRWSCRSLNHVRPPLS